MTKKKPKYTQEQEDLRAVLSTLPGRRLFWRFLDRAGINSTHPGSTNEEVWMNAAVRCYAQEFFVEMIDTCPERYIQMLQEQNPGLTEQSEEEEDDED